MLTFGTVRYSSTPKQNRIRNAARLLNDIFTRAERLGEHAFEGVLAIFGDRDGIFALGKVRGNIRVRPLVMLVVGTRRARRFH